MSTAPPAQRPSPRRMSPARFSPSTALAVSFFISQATMSSTGSAAMGQSQAARPASLAQSPGSSRVAGGSSPTKQTAPA